MGFWKWLTGDNMHWRPNFSYKKCRACNNDTLKFEHDKGTHGDYDRFNVKCLNQKCSYESTLTEYSEPCYHCDGDVYRHKSKTIGDYDECSKCEAQEGLTKKSHLPEIEY